MRDVVSQKYRDASYFNRNTTAAAKPNSANSEKAINERTRFARPCMRERPCRMHLYSDSGLVFPPAPAACKAHRDHQCSVHPMRPDGTPQAPPLRTQHRERALRKT